jgi:FkbM family methyltransferase
VPAFLIDTHDPVTQDVYISGAAHAGVAPWDPFVWDRIVALSRGVPKGSVFVDVGANLGYFSLMAASLGYTVVSFEPMSRNARKLARSVARNGFAGRVRLYQNAVGPADGRLVSLRETDTLNQGNGRVTGEPPQAPGGVFGVDYVDTVTLSSVLLFAASQSTGAHIVKVDVEGLEPGVLEGARQWICAQTVRHVLIEFSEATRASPASAAVGMFTFMQRAGYTVSDVSVESPAPIDYARLLAGDFDGVPPNLLFSLRDMPRENPNGACSEP